MRNLFEVPSAELEAALLAIVTEKRQAAFYRLPLEVAERVGGSVMEAPSLGVRDLMHTHQVHAAQVRWATKVRRALEKLVAAGAIVKVRRGQRGPDGATAPGVMYYTHEEFKAAGERARQKWRERDELRERWGKIRQRLAGGPGVALGDDYRITAAEWERLLDGAGW